MAYLLLGFAVLVALLVAARFYTGANPQVLARQLRILAGVAVFAIAFAFAVRGALGYAGPLAAVGAWLLWGGGGPNWGGSGSAPSAGRTSRIETEFLEVELDLDTGLIRGRVLKGTYAGRELEYMSPIEMAQLWQDCRFADPQSAQVVEVYLDRAHPTWREDMARTGGGEGSAASGGSMTRAQALDVLGLGEDAGDDDIRRAHRDLMMKMHPDRGGSTFIAAKINEAKDVLLGR
jgi:hypothetical protein